MQNQIKVLIVPCGIEIGVILQNFITELVLIVPCGIEILRIPPDGIDQPAVLIVPCGIEIADTHNETATNMVLIVPCGIEIAMVLSYQKDALGS